MIQLRAHRLAAAALAVFLAGATPAAAGSDETSKKLEELSKRWQEAMTRLQAPGLSVAVVQGDRVLLSRGFGVRDPESEAPVTPETMFYIASSTKSFVALAIQMLVEEGRLDLDRPVATYLPRFTLSDPQVARQVTLRDLLAHRRGLDNYPIEQAEAYTGLIDEDKFYRLLGEVEPGASFSYANLNFTLLGRVIEAVTGTSWKEFVAERILKPAAMNRTTTSATGLWADSDVGIPTVEIEGAWRRSPVLKTDSTMHAAGGMAASANDLARWLRLNLGGGSIDGTRLLSAERLREMHTPQVEVGSSFFVFQREAYGLGWYVGSFGGEPLIHHFGSYVGSRAHVSFMPKHGIGVAAIQNNADPTGFLVDLVAIDVYRALAGVESEDALPRLIERVDRRRQQTKERQAATRPLTVSELSLPIASYAGTFEHGDWGEISIEVEGDRLISKWGSLRPTLHAAEEADRFELADTPHSRNKASFVVDSKERVVSAVTIELGESSVLFERLAPAP